LEFVQNIGVDRGFRPATLQCDRRELQHSILRDFLILERRRSSGKRANPRENCLVRSLRKFVAAGVFFAAASFAGAAFAEETSLSLEIKDHRFDPAELHAPAGKAITLTVKNLDATPEEFESKPLRIEKLVAGKAQTTVRIPALAAGKYNFFGDYHEKTAQGVLIVE
jgi:plastocyanin